MERDAGEVVAMFCEIYLFFLVNTKSIMRSMASSFKRFCAGVLVRNVSDGAIGCCRYQLVSHVGGQTLLIITRPCHHHPHHGSWLADL